MMLTEQEARKRQCFRVFGVALETVADTLCEGSRCMAWRWDPGKLTGGYSDDGMVALTEPPTHGYCGLAGKP